MSRFRMVPFEELDRDLQNFTRIRWTHVIPWIPHEAYSYPLTKKGKLANSGRYISKEKAQELKDAYDVRKVMES